MTDLPPDYQQLVQVIAAHRLSNVITLAEANRMFVMMFWAKKHGRTAPSFRDLLAAV